MLPYMKQRRFLALALVAAMAFAMVAATACGEDEPTATPEPEPTNTPAAAVETPTPEPTEPANTPTPEPTEPANTPTPAVATPTPLPQPGEGVTVQPAKATWTTGFFNEAVVSAGLEELGYEVEEASEAGLDAPVFYESVATGDVTYWANGWFPLHDQYRETLEQGAEIAGTIAEAGALQGYLVDAASQEEYDITSLADFEDEEIRDAFDSDDDGKADLYGCPPGWGCHDAINDHLSEFGLEDHIEHRTAGYSANMAEVISRVQNDEPVLYYTWTPNWTVYRLAPGEDVMWIEVPEDLGNEGWSIDGVAGCVNDPCLMGFPGNDINVVANSEFLDDNPAAAEFFSQVSIPLDDIFLQNNRMDAGEDSQEDIDRHAQEWIATNQEQWDEWIQQAVEAAE